MRHACVRRTTCVPFLAALRPRLACMLVPYNASLGSGALCSKSASAHCVSRVAAVRAPTIYREGVNSKKPHQRDRCGTKGAWLQLPQRVHASDGRSRGEIRGGGAALRLSGWRH